MRMTFLRNINFKKRRRKTILGGAILVLILITIVFKDFSFRIINRPALYIIRPFWEIRGQWGDWWGGLKAGFKEKKSLQNENVSLREKIMQLETDLALKKILEKENAALKADFSQEERQNFMLASIILRPPQTPYDIFIIDSGSEESVREGMQVSAFGHVLLGYVTDVFDNISKIKLISSFGEETNVFFETSQTPAIAIGLGGENFKIALSRAVKVEIGERVITFGRYPMLIGIVEKIEHQTTDPFQEIFFRLPVNIQYLNQVFLLKK